MNARTELLARANLVQICRHRTMALEKMKEAAEALAAAYKLSKEANALGRLATMGSTYQGRSDSENAAYSALFGGHFDPEASFEAYRKNLDACVWTHLMDASGMKHMMDRHASEEFHKSLQGDVIEATEENVRATLEGLMRDSELIFRRGLVNAFAGLDRRFKSHDGFKIGSRIILTYAFSADRGSIPPDSATWKTIADVERVMAVLDGKAPDTGLRAAVEKDRPHYGPQQSVTESRYFRIKAFMNGNAHLWFLRDDLVTKVNQILAEHYGEVLPDAYAEADPEDVFRAKSTEVARNLQFYRSPPQVVARLLHDTYWAQAPRVLEPSAGDGSIAIAAAEQGAEVHAIEVERSRCDVLKPRAGRLRKGSCTVQQANFLQVPPAAIYDLVLMNPPFFGNHWMEHVRHAFDFLKPGGRLRAVLPATAEVRESKKHDAFRAWAEKNKDRWSGPFEDLPPESFAESGTMIQTVILSLKKPG